MKTCNTCKIDKNNNEFDFQRNDCKECRKAYRRSIPKKNYSVSVTEKKCTLCKVTKSAEDFFTNKQHLSGLMSCCKSCDSNNKKKHYAKDPSKAIARSTARYEKYKGTEVINAPTRARQKRRLKEDPKYLLTRRLRNRLYYALQKKSWKKNTKFYEYIGCDLEFLKQHIQLQFTEGMTWENQGEWHIDHIIPLDSASTEEGLYKLCHFSNLQPMWAIENIKKGTK